uniref:Tim44-like domain-containing protein n=1 Tax=Strigamia maritima TaxID=126957 RepID=T1JHW5_STRMM
MAAPIFATGWAKSCLSQQHINFYKHFTFSNHFYGRRTFYTRHSVGIPLKFDSNSEPKSTNVVEKYSNPRTLSKIKKTNFSTFPCKQTARKSLPEHDKSKDFVDESPDDDDSDKNRLISLMDFPEVLWPNMLKSFKNIMLSRLVINWHFDNEFSLNAFMVGAKQAVIQVSKILSDGNVQDLRGLVTEEAIAEIKPNLARMSLQQRQELAVTEDDIYFGFVFLIGIIFDENKDPEKRYVEITTCFHSIRGLGDIKRFENLSNWQDDRERINLVNYRFIREYTKGVDGDWIINKLNHFKPPCSYLSKK